MPFPASPASRYTASRQLISGADLNTFNDSYTSFQSALAAGVAQADATAINAANFEVLAGSANNAGVRLPVSYPGAEVWVLNNSANSTIIYATGTDRIQQTAAGAYYAANAGATIATLTSYKFRCVKKGFWQSVKTTATP